MLKKIVISLIIILTALAGFFYITSNKTMFITTAMIDITIIVFATLVWLNDRQHNQEINQRIVSFPDINMLKDIINKQANMLNFDRIENKHDIIEVYKGKDKVITVQLEKDKNGNTVLIDGKYIAKIQAPEYVLQNIDEEIWSYIGRKR